MAVPCTEHLFLTGRKGVGKSTLLRAVLEGKRLGGFFTRRITGIFERPSIHLLRAAEGQQPSPENLVCLCGERRTDLFDRLGPAALADAADCDVIVMDELGPSEAAALEFQKAVLAALDGDKPVCGGAPAGTGRYRDGGEPRPAAAAALWRKVNRKSVSLTGSAQVRSGQGRAFFRSTEECPFLWTVDTV